jgi:uncharacterized protein (TIGR02453 family)
MPSTGFRGWPDEAFSFFAQLELDNTRPFWLAHKAVYEESVKEPMVLLGAEVADEFGPLHVFRPNRDVRFSKDKSLYKTHIGAVTEGDGGEMFYVQLSAEGLFAASGYYQMARDQLERFREAVADDEAGPELERRLAAITKKGFTVGGEALKVAPRGYPRDHPRVQLLRHKGVTVSKAFAPAAWVHSRGALKRITDVWRAAAPAHEWLDANVGPSTEPPEEDGWTR